MVTLEARAYGVARHIQATTGAWTIVNDVAGFIGPEVFRTVDQLQRACLEDIVMAKLHGLTMGLDVCATFHMGIAPAALREATRRIVERRRRPISWPWPATRIRCSAISRRRSASIPSCGARRTADAASCDAAVTLGLAADGESALRTAPIDRVALRHLQKRGRRSSVDRRAARGRRGEDRTAARAGTTGTGHGDLGPPAARARMDAIYEQARRALYAALDAGVDARRVAASRGASARRPRDREDYLARPKSGESIRADDAERIVSAFASAIIAAAAIADRDLRRPQRECGQPAAAQRAAGAAARARYRGHSCRQPSTS